MSVSTLADEAATRRARRLARWRIRQKANSGCMKKEMVCPLRSRVRLISIALFRLINFSSHLERGYDAGQLNSGDMFTTDNRIQVRRSLYGFPRSMSPQNTRASTFCTALCSLKFTLSWRLPAPPAADDRTSNAAPIPAKLASVLQRLIPILDSPGNCSIHPFAVKGRPADTRIFCFGLS